MTDARGRSLELFFIDGDPEGMLTAEVFNWTGHVLMTPRTRIADALRRPEATRTGVYILTGDREGEPALYIGEAETLRSRLADHVKGKDWWTTAVMISTAGDSLHKAHVKYLEARLVETAIAAGSVRLDNANTPPRPSLSEAHVANMEVFLDTLLMILPALRLGMFLDKKRPAVSDAEPAGDAGVSFVLHSERIGFSARAHLDGADFVIEAGSTARAEWVGDEKWDIGSRSDRENLIANGIIVITGDTGRFSQNYAFSSPSAAATVIAGRGTGGTANWKVEGTGQTYKDWEADQIAGEAA